MNKILVAAALFTLSACASPTTANDTASGPSIKWQCDAGASFNAQMTTGGNAEVTAGGHTYHLPGVMAASGERYFDGHVEYWAHGEEAMLNGAPGGPYNNCRLQGG